MSIVIAGISTRAIAQSASRAGYHIRTADFFGDYDQRLCCPNISLRRDLGLPFSAWGLFRAVLLNSRQPVDGIVYLANLENHPEVIAAFEQRTRVLGNSARTVAAVRDWNALSAAVTRLGARTPRTLRPGEVPAKGRWLLKPHRSGGGHAIRPWRGEPPAGDRLVQEYIAGLPCSAAFAADGRRAVVLGLTEQLIGRREFGAGGFHYCGNIFPLDLPPAAKRPALTARLQDVASGLTRTFGLMGISGIDFVLAGAEPVILEVNPRYTGSMELLERATGMSIFDVHMRALEGYLPNPEEIRSPDGFWGKAIVFANRDVVARATERWLQRGICDVPFAGDRIRTGAPVCTVMARGPTRTACLKALQASAQEIRHDLDG